MPKMEEIQLVQNLILKVCHRCVNLHTIKESSEDVGGDLEATSPFPADLKIMVAEGGYLPKQIFCVHEMGFGGGLPYDTFVWCEEEQASGFMEPPPLLPLC
jgi:hypothetical protein